MHHFRGNLKVCTTERTQSLVQNHIWHVLKSRKWHYMKAMNNNNKGSDPSTACEDIGQSPLLHAEESSGEAVKCCWLEFILQLIYSPLRHSRAVVLVEQWLVQRAACSGHRFKSRHHSLCVRTLDKLEY